MGKRSNGEGSIYKSNGKFVVALTIGYNAEGKPVRKKFSADTKNAAVEILNHQRERYAQNSCELDDNITIRQWAEKCLEIYMRPRVRVNTYAWYKTLTKKYIKENPAGFIKLSKFRTINMQELVNSIAGGAKLKRSVYQLYNLYFNNAAEEGIITANPIKKIALPPLPRRVVKEYTPQQIADMLKQLESEPMFRMAIIMLAATGIRRSELLALTWRSIDMDKCRVHIDKAVILGENGAEISDTKSEKSRRTIYLSPFVMSEIKRYRACDNFILGAYIFNNKGKIYRPDDFSVALARRVGEPIRLHDLRHSFASRLVRGGVNIKVLQELLGHSDIRLTLDTYSHVLDEEKQAAAKVAADIFG